MDRDQAKSEIDKVYDQLDSERDDLNREREQLHVVNRRLEVERDEAVRREGMFRRALAQYLTDYTALGVPSEETLQLIQDLVREHQH